jgi:hypothetical protein
MLIKVSHECPISILDRSHEFSDFDYCLVHLLDRYPMYHEYYKNARKIYNREVLLDNSIFELGHAFDSDKFEKAALDLEPNMFIVPDVLENCDETIISYANWLTTGRIKNIKDSFLTKAIGAVQGKTWDELVRCYRFMSDNTDMIAISFDFSYYLTTGRGKTDLEKFCSGRQRFIHQLIDEGIWNWDKPHHLLGCSLAKEFRYYINNNIYNIVSCDTSNPIVAALHGLEYDADYGLQTKPKTKLADLIDHKVTDDEMAIIDYNTKMFKKILCR